MTPLELEELVLVMRKNYVLKCGDVEISPLAFIHPAPELPKGVPVGTSNAGYPTDDELLFASSPYPMTPEELATKGARNESRPTEA